MCVCLQVEARAAAAELELDELQQHTLTALEDAEFKLADYDIVTARIKQLEAAGAPEVRVHVHAHLPPQARVNGCRQWEQELIFAVDLNEV